MYTQYSITGVKGTIISATYTSIHVLPCDNTVINVCSLLKGRA